MNDTWLWKTLTYTTRIIGAYSVRMMYTDIIERKLVGNVLTPPSVLQMIYISDQYYEMD